MSKTYYQIGAAAPTVTKAMGQFDYRAKAQKEMLTSKAPYAVWWSDLNAQHSSFYPYETLAEAATQYDKIAAHPNDPSWNSPAKTPVVYAVIMDRKNPLDGSNEDLKPDTDESRYIYAEGYWVAEAENTIDRTTTIHDPGMSTGKKAAVGIGLGLGIFALIEMAKH